MKNLNKSIVYFFGYGAVARCLVDILLEKHGLNPSLCTFIDEKDLSEELFNLISKGAQFTQRKITKESLSELFSTIPSGAIAIDLTVYVDSFEMILQCHQRGIYYVNAALEEWQTSSQDAGSIPPQQRTLYHRQGNFEHLRGKKNGATAILDHGANPGLVSHFTKAALLEISERCLSEKKIVDEKRELLQDSILQKNFAQIACNLGVKSIHVSEWDSQILSKPKEPGEFVNTWSVDGFYEESIAPAELGWGTHEKRLPPLACEHANGSKNQICLAKMGCKTYIRTWVPSGPRIGMLIRHGEAFTLSHFLTVQKNGAVFYRPTVHYAYNPSDAAIASLWELESRGFVLQEKQRIVRPHEIVSGKDELGVLLMGHPFGAWWYGSVLSIEESQNVVQGYNATLIQVAAGVVAAVMYILEYPDHGIMTPEDLDHKFVLDIAQPYLGKIISEQTNWNPLQNRMDKELFGSWDESKSLDASDPWQFINFLL